jgi:hypothetical protein
MDVRDLQQKYSMHAISTSPTSVQTLPNFLVRWLDTAIPTEGYRVHELMPLSHE